MKAIELEKVSLTDMEKILTTDNKYSLLVNRLTTNKKYSFLNRENLTQPTEMDLSLKQKTFSRYSGFLKSPLNFRHFQKKMILIADVFPKLRTKKDVVRSISNKSRFRRPLDREHGKRTETLLQSERQLLCHIY